MTLVGWVSWLVAVPASSFEPHPHNGILEPFKRQPPKRYNMVVSADVDRKLQAGKTFIDRKDLDNGFRRTIAIKNIDAPASIIFDQIVDVASYPSKIDGIIGTDVYSDERNLNGLHTIYARYRVRFAALVAESYVYHEIDPFTRCMTFHLDYSRKSDVSDQIGYWWVEPLGRDRSRVFYAAVSTVPVWVPPFAVGSILDLVAKRALSWVDVESRKAFAARSPPPTVLIRGLMDRLGKLKLSQGFPRAGLQGRAAVNAKRSE